MSETTLSARKAVLVLGMHRSGTSLLSGLMAQAGFSIGKSVMPPAEDNPKGFFENQRIVDFNERILNSLGMGWSSWQPLPVDWLEQVSAFADEATSLIEEEFGEETQVCIKDPRMCRLFPFWKDILLKLRFELYMLLTTRGLGEVSASLQKRDGMSESQANVLWLRYNLDALQSSLDLTGLHVSYQDVLEDAGGSLSKISQWLGEPLELNEKDFVDEALRHHEQGSEPFWAETLLRDCARFPVQPDAVLEEVVFPLLGELADRDRELASALAGEVSSVDGLSGKEAMLFAQAEDARQHAQSLSRELESGRHYISDLEREHSVKDQIINRQEAALQEMKRQSDEFVGSLQTSLEDSQRYVASLEEALSDKEVELKRANEGFEEILQSKDEYAQSLVADLQLKQSALENSRLELTSIQRRLKDELRRFPIQRKISKMFKRKSDV